jgi:uncharacterized protein (DUF3820 family)
MRKITEHTKLPFGAHRGIKIRDIPDGYLKWCEDNLKDGDFHEWAVAATEELKRREKDNSTIQSLEEQANQLLREAGFDPKKL